MVLYAWDLGGQTLYSIVYTDDTVKLTTNSGGSSWGNSECDSTHAVDSDGVTFQVRDTADNNICGLTSDTTDVSDNDDMYTSSNTRMKCAYDSTGGFYIYNGSTYVGNFPNVVDDEKFNISKDGADCVVTRLSDSATVSFTMGTAAPMYFFVAAYTGDWNTIIQLYGTSPPPPSSGGTRLPPPPAFVRF